MPRDVDDEIQYQAARIALIGAEVASFVRQRSSTSLMLNSANEIHELCDRLEQWQETLPEQLKLSSMKSERRSGLEDYQEKGVTSIQTLYLQTYMLLYRQFLVMSEDAQSMSPMQSRHVTTEMTYTLERQGEQCILAAQETVRLLHNMISDYGRGAFSVRCWLVV